MTGMIYSEYGQLRLRDFSRRLIQENSVRSFSLPESYEDNRAKTSEALAKMWNKSFTKSDLTLNLEVSIL